MKVRKNFLPTAIITFLFWLGLGLLIWLTPPEGMLPVAVFFFLAFWALWLPLSVIFANTRRGLFVTVGILGTLFMKPAGMFSYLSLGAWWVIILTIELWLSSKRD